MSTFLCCIDLENSPWCRLRKEGWYKTTVRDHDISMNKIKYCFDAPIKTMLIFVKFALELLTL